MAGEKNFAGKVVIDVLQIRLIFQKVCRQCLRSLIQIPAAKLCSACCPTAEWSKPLT
jgi:hypothetical protein